LANDLLNSKLFRPPYGRIKKRQAQLLRKRYKIVMWNLLSMDYSRWVSPKRCASIVINNLRPGSIIVFHDSKKAERNMMYGLKKLIAEAKRRGLDFGVIE
jgi:peptidoglycan-N-acetylglucosamine deacetylase